MFVRNERMAEQAPRRSPLLRGYWSMCGARAYWQMTSLHKASGLAACRHDCNQGSDCHIQRQVALAFNYVANVQERRGMCQR